MITTQITKHIVEGLLGEEAKKDILVYAGSFRPPTRSDYNLLLKAIEKNPGVDEIHVFVGDAESEGLNQDDSVEIFKMFGEHFPRDFYVHKSEESPVSDVYAYANKFPTYDIDWLFGVREGNSDDFKEISDRTKSVNKYENLSISPVVYDDKATEREVGAAANMGKDELAKYMPKVLTYKELDDVYNMLQPKQLDEAMYDYADDIINKIAEEGWEYYETMGSLSSKAAKVAKQARKENKKLFTLAYERDSSSDPVIQYINVFWSDKGDSINRDVIEGGTMQDYEDIKDAAELNLNEVEDEDLGKFDEAINKIVETGVNFYAMLSPRFHGSKVADFLKREEARVNQPQFAIQDFKNGIVVIFSDGTRFTLGEPTEQDIEDLKDAGDIDLREVADVDLGKFEDVINKISEEEYEYYPAEDLSPESFQTQLMLNAFQKKKNLFTITQNISGGGMWNPDDSKQYSTTVFLATPDSSEVEKYFIHNTTKQDLEDILGAADESLDTVLKEAKNVGRFEEMLNKISEGDYYYVPGEDLYSIDGLKMRQVRYDHDYDIDKPMFSFAIQKVSPPDIVARFSDEPNNEFWIKDASDQDIKDLRDTVEMFAPTVPHNLNEMLHTVSGKELKKGIAVEMEHTDDKETAKKIALDHLAEDPKYYTKLATLGLEENHDPQGEMEHYKDLMDYMSSNGLNIKPYPAINFVDDDEDNAENLFGVTAYYDPNDKTVTLYTYGRHPKDILRSFAHELVHVHQDNEGRIGNIQTTNTNQDDDLVELEKEAYLTGNMMFRQWTDSIDEGKKKEYGVDAYAAELSRLRENKENLSEEQQTIKKVYSDVNDVLAGTDVPDVEWTEDGRKLWEFLFTIPVPVSLLSSTTNQERKQQWVDDTFKIKPEIIFRRSFDKHEFSEPGAVLIDNKPETIESWEEKGGIGILHKNTDDTIKQLKDLGLYGYE